jgi:hypothetical protein
VANSLVTSRFAQARSSSGIMKQSRKNSAFHFASRPLAGSSTCASCLAVDDYTPLFDEHAPNAPPPPYPQHTHTHTHTHTHITHHALHHSEIPLLALCKCLHSRHHCVSLCAPPSCTALHCRYTVDKPEFGKWEAAFSAMGCEIHRQGEAPKDKVPQRARSGSLSRIMSISRSGGGGSSLTVPQQTSLSGKLSKSSNDLSGGADGGAAKKGLCLITLPHGCKRG